jgi:hypothetical protein
MALRRASNDKRTGDGALPPPSGGVAVEDRVGPSVEECVAVGQALVEAGHLKGEMLAPALADGSGDLWEFGEILLTKYGIGRIEYAQALGKAVGLASADTRTMTADKELASEVSEPIARRFKFVPMSPPARSSSGWPPTPRRSRR